MPAVYLAHAIDRSNPDDFHLYERVASELVKHGTCVYRPSTAWNLPEEPQPDVQRVNLAAMRACQALMVIWCEGQWSVGTPIELALAWECGMKIAWVTDVKDTSWAASYLVSSQNAQIRLFSPDEVIEATQWLLNL